jgi:hypothetical protein
MLNCEENFTKGELLDILGGKYALLYGVGKVHSVTPTFVWLKMADGTFKLVSKKFLRRSGVRTNCEAAGGGDADTDGEKTKTGDGDGDGADRKATKEGHDEGEFARGETVAVMKGAHKGQRNAKVAGFTDTGLSLRVKLENGESATVRKTCAKRESEMDFRSDGLVDVVRGKHKGEKAASITEELNAMLRIKISSGYVVLVNKTSVREAASTKQSGSRKKDEKTGRQSRFGGRQYW